VQGLGHGGAQMVVPPREGSGAAGDLRAGLFDAREGGIDPRQRRFGAFSRHARFASAISSRGIAPRAANLTRCTLSAKGPRTRIDAPVRA